MKKTKSKCGYVVYETSLTECVRITDGYGICAMCAKPSFKLYLIPVLNSAYCEKCFNDWNESAIYCKEDLDFESDYVKFFEKRAKERGVEVVYEM